MTPKEKAIELIEKMGIERISITTSVIPRPETTYYGWCNGKYAKQCALIAVNEIIEATKTEIDRPDYNGVVLDKYWQEVKTELEKL